ncbi:MAG: hypothetical protein Solumvirus5_9 [Solumvirus sp.]|uniref:Uncharacterized protein n=1 Tax=Solumvirus sp. TaxID=2487773 RepID=A0A3G5AGN3_9VIRU|nr:MAG: hypothetical protein Solumvirus5_9 [Solumvirus sp.]
MSTPLKVRGYVVRIHDPVNFDIDIDLTDFQRRKITDKKVISYSYKFYDTPAYSTLNINTTFITTESRDKDLSESKIYSKGVSPKNKNGTAATTSSGSSSSAAPQFAAPLKVVLSKTPIKSLTSKTTTSSTKDVSLDSNPLDTAFSGSKDMSFDIAQLRLLNRPSQNLKPNKPVELPQIITRSCYRCRLKGISAPLSEDRNNDKSIGKVYRLVYREIKQQIDLQGGWVDIEIGPVDKYQRLLVSLYDPISHKDLSSIHLSHKPVFYDYVIGQGR